MRWLLVLLTIPCFPLPQSPVFVHGSGSVESKDLHSLSISASDQAILNWDSFSVDSEETLIFTLPSTDSIALNRVLGNERSEILGRIASNGQIILLNPAGILIGKEASIDTAAWIASTLDLHDQTFLSTKEWHFSGNSDHSITIDGSIRSNRIAIFAKDIFCSGNVSADRIEMAAGLTTQLLSNTIQTTSSKGKLAFSGAAQGTNLSLFGDAISLSGALTGTSIFVGGSREGKNPSIANATSLSVLPNAAITTSRGGEAIFFSEGHLSFDGTVYSPAGFVEVSGLHTLSFHGLVDTDRSGTFLLDPNEIRIVAAPGMTNPAPLTAFYDGSPAVSATILNTDISNLLTMTSVVIQTNNSIAGGSGDIIQDSSAPIVWATNGTNLTLHANHSILLSGDAMSGSILSTGTDCVITLIADQGDVVLTSSPGLPATVETTGLHTVGATAIAVICPNGSFSINSAIDTPTFLDTVDTTSAGDIHVIAQSINIVAANALTQNSTASIQTRRGDAYLTISGPINLTGGDANPGLEANASAVVGITIMGGPIGGNLYFTAGSLNFDSRNSISGGRTGTSLTAYGLGLNSGNISGTVAGDILLQAGSPIASGSGLSSLFEGQIDLAVGGNVTMISNPAATIAFCGSGIRTLFSGGAGSSRAVNVAIAGDFTAISGGGMDSGAGIGGLGDVSVAVAGSALFQTTNGTAGSVSGTCLFSDAGSVQFAARTASFLGNSPTPLSSRVTAFADVSLATQGDLTFDFGEVLSTTGNVSLRSLTGSIFMNNGTVWQAATQLLARASVNLEVINSTATSLTDRIIFVVDDAFPTPPLIGPGSFIMDPSSLSAPFGISIYTARQNQNTIINSTLNGALFIPGSLFIDTAQEVWCTYFPNGLSTLPFTIFYKDCQNIVTYEANLIVSEFLRNMHPYDEAFGWFESFYLREPDFFSELYFIRRRNLPFNNPKSWTALLNESSMNE